MHSSRALLTRIHLIRSLELKPGQTESFVPPGDLRITNVALGDELADEKARTSVKLTYQAPGGPDEEDDDEEDDEDEEEGGEPVTTVLCSLTPGKVCDSSYATLNINA